MIQSRTTKWIAASIWLSLVAAGVIWAKSHGLTAAEIVAAFYRHVSENPWAASIYVFLYAIRPITFLPAMWLTIASGSLFGFLPGVMLTILGENTSAATAYAIARFFRTDADAEEDAAEELGPFRKTLQEQAFPTVIVLRAAYLPFDLVNFGCGLLRVPWWPYFFGTFIGILPPMITFVSFGASINFLNLVENLDNFDPVMLFDEKQLMISGALLLVSMVIAWYAHRRRVKLAQGSQA